MTKEKENETNEEIEVGNPSDLRPTKLPLVVKLPASASNAQKEFAKILNAYAYKNPTKWEIKKDTLIAKLKELKNAPDPVEQETGLKYTKNSLQEETE